MMPGSGGAGASMPSVTPMFRMPEGADGSRRAMTGELRNLLSAIACGLRVLVRGRGAGRQRALARALLRVVRRALATLDRS